MDVSQTIKRIILSPSRIIALVLIPVILVVYWSYNKATIQTDLPLILGLMTAPLTIRRTSKPPGYGLIVSGIVLIVLLNVFKSATLHYLLSALLILMILESIWGKQGILPILLIIVVSPALSNILNIWSFPLRMEMTAWAGWVMTFLHYPTEIIGNTIRYGGQEFAVDPECMGLRLLTTSLVCCTALMAHFLKNRSIALWESVSWLTLALLFSIIANFVRLLLLIMLHVLPDNPLHDAIGITSLIVYVVLPLLWLIRRRAQKDRILQPDLSVSKGSSSVAYTLILMTLSAFQIQTALAQGDMNADAANLNTHLTGYSSTTLTDGVVKYSSEKALVYVKPAVSFFQGSHDPRYCWRGSGYQFRKSQLETPENSFQVFTAILESDDSRLYTAWWYQSLQTSTPHDWQWRWNTLRHGESYQLVNVTCANREDLLRAIQTFRMACSASEMHPLKHP
ncbi:MAG: exosortase N [Flavobacteriales bacterium]|nr:exosortase N [Bacteroidota bacterium]MCB9240133.1 exosortase N [Flavobacteriales bacterium]